VRHWGYVINGLYKTANIILEEAPWYIFALFRLADIACDSVLPIKFPPLPLKLKDSGDIEANDNKEWTTWRDWYGDLGQFICVHFHMPINDFCFRKIKEKTVEIDYDKLKKIFHEDDKDFWDREEEKSNKRRPK